MDFKKGETENESKLNNDSNTLKQNNEPIISFSPERCRFDSAQSNFQKSSIPFSVADFQVEDPFNSSAQSLPASSLSSSNSNSITNPKQSSSNTTPTPVPSNISLAQKEHNQSITSSHQKQTHSYLHNESSSAHLPSSSYSSSTIFSGVPVINTHTVPLNSAANNTGKTTSESLVSPPTTFGETNSISLMVNGAVLSGNNTSTTTTSTLDLHKRLEKRIAQASAAAAATSSNPVSAGNKTKENDSILAEILSASSIDLETANNYDINSSSENHDRENQITFSPHKTSKNSIQTDFQQKLPSSIWDSGSSASDIELLWESKNSSQKNKETAEAASAASSTEISVSFMDSPQHKQTNQLQKEINTHLLQGESRNGVGGSSSYEDAARLPLSSNIIPYSDPTNRGNSSLENVHANSDIPSPNACTNNNNSISTNVNKSSCEQESKSTTHNLKNNNATNMTAVTPPSTSSTSTVVVVNSGFDIRKVSALLPPQRLAIPCKPNPQLQSSHSTACKNKSMTIGVSPNASSTDNSLTETANDTFSRNNSQIGANSATAVPSVPNVHRTSTRKASMSETSCTSGNGNVILPTGNGNVKTGSNSSKLSSEKKPLVQWDSDESEEELSFFPPAKRGVITDNLSIDNMSLSGEEDDLHLTPPRPLGKKCPCDPRTWLERRTLSSSRHHGDSIRNISAKPCVIS